MDRVVEPELMDGVEQAQAYAAADFDAVNQAFVERFLERFPDVRGRIVDLGCGPADIPIRLAKERSDVTLLAVDGAASMLELARQAVVDAELEERIQLLQVNLPWTSAPSPFDGLLSNSLLHHLHDPNVMWSTVRALTESGTPVLIQDLRRPDSDSEARGIVHTYAADEEDVLRTDFLNSLRAAFTADEVRAQLSHHGLSQLEVTEIGDRHLEICGRRP